MRPQDMAAVEAAKEALAQRKRQQTEALAQAKAAAEQRKHQINTAFTDQKTRTQFVVRGEKEKVRQKQAQQQEERANRRQRRRQRVVVTHLAKAYATLGLDDTASMEAVKKAYREKLKVYHPDHVGNDPHMQAEATSKTIELQEAYETILQCLGGERDA